ncbi:MAG: SocA family protein [Actinobacteria bacterium]|nr:SocA family protein [Actinomycetota bacterium]
MASNLAEVVLYISRKSEGDPAFGTTKLHKILFLADFYAFGMWGEPITDTRYKRYAKGPFAISLKNAENELVSQNRARVEERQYFDYTQRRIVATDEPHLSLREEQIKLLDQAIDALGCANATGVSNWSHQLRPWLHANANEDIPYHTVFILHDEPITLDDLEWGETKLREMHV